MQFSRIRLQVTLFAGICLIVTVGLVVARATQESVRQFTRDTETDLLEKAMDQSGLITGEIDSAMQAPRGLALALAAAADRDVGLELSREDVLALLAKHLDNGQGLRGISRLGSLTPSTLLTTCIRVSPVTTEVVDLLPTSRILGRGFRVSCGNPA